MSPVSMDVFSALFLFAGLFIIIIITELKHDLYKDFEMQVNADSPKIAVNPKQKNYWLLGLYGPHGIWFKSIASEQ